VKVHTQSKTETWPYTAAVNVHYVLIVDVHRGNRTLKVRWQPKFEDENVTALPSIVPQNWTFRSGVSCDSRADAYIESVSENNARSCRFEMNVHVASLCSHPRLMPPQPREAQTIQCNADRATLDWLERQQQQKRSEGHAKLEVPSEVAAATHVAQTAPPPEVRDSADINAA